MEDVFLNSIFLNATSLDLTDEADLKLKERRKNERIFNKSSETQQQHD